MRPLLSHTRWTTAALCALTALVAPAGALGATAPQPSRTPVSALGTLAQLSGVEGCVVARSKPRSGCALARGLRGPAPFLGSHAIAITPDGKNVYVASSTSDAIAIFTRASSSGELTQRAGTAGCIAAKGAGGCAKGIGLDGPNSVAVSADGRSVYATSLNSNAVVALRRKASTGALSQDGAGSCVANVATTGCVTGRALDGPDVVAVSPDGKNVYVGAFKGNAVAMLTRNPSTGALTQPADSSGCLTNVATTGCATGRALGAPEGLAISADGNTVYIAAAASNAVAILARNASTGALTQASDGSGCIAAPALSGCATGTQLGGANAVAVSPDDGDVYVTSLLSNSVTSFTRTPASGLLTQQAGTSACVIYVLAVGCSLGQALSAPEGLAVAPDGASLYTTAYGSGALDVFNRSGAGALIQKPRAAGCQAASATLYCTPARGLLGASSVAVSPDGRHVYSAAFKSNAVGVFKRVTRAKG